MEKMGAKNKVLVGWVIRQLADGSPGKENKRTREFKKLRLLLTRKLIRKV
jgi:hypothetical protein